MKVAELARGQLATAAEVLTRACAFDAAGIVAEEKLFGDGPTSSPTTFGAWDDDRLVGVAAIAGRWIRVCAVDPAARRRGAGGALLAACEQLARRGGATKLGVLDQPGNYLAPGVDERNVESIEWLEKRGFVRGSELRSNVLLAVRNNERVTRDALTAAIAGARERGYEVRRAERTEREPLVAAIAGEFGGAWPFEISRALTFDPSGVHVALRDGAYCAFAAHDGNNRGLGWFGPTGTWPAHRGQGLGEALLRACLDDVAAVHPHCEVAWIGPRPFYDKVAGIAAERRFVTLSKPL
jgi:GNAT superfamily N-acetyltransferase